MIGSEETSSNTPLKEMLNMYGYLSDVHYADSIGKDKIEEIDLKLKNPQYGIDILDFHSRDFILSDNLTHLLKTPRPNQLNIVMSGFFHLATMTEALRGKGFLPMIMPREKTDQKGLGLIYTYRESYVIDKKVLRRRAEKDNNLIEVGIPAICVPDTHGVEYDLILPTGDELRGTGITEINFYAEHGDVSSLNTLDKLRRDFIYKNMGKRLTDYEASGININIFGLELNQYQQRRSDMGALDIGFD